MKLASLHNVVGFVRRLAVSESAALSDCELLERFVQRRDEFAFTELVRRHGPMVLAACRRVLRHEHDAEDVFQATFLVLAQRAASIRTADTLAAWLYQVTYRLALRARQISKRRQELPVADDIGANALPDLCALDDELARLPDEYRGVVVLCYLEGRTQQEAARILATTEDTVNSRLKRARAMLRLRYARLGGAALIAAGALSNEAIAGIVTHAIDYAATGTCGASASAMTLAKGAFPMFGATTKTLAALVILAGLLFAGAFVAAPASDAKPRLALAPDEGTSVALVAEPIDKAKGKRGCIILWMNGGPSQLDTFDPKPGNVSLFKAIDTNVKGLQFSETLPKLAKQANHLAIIRSMTHREGDHMRGTHLMQTAHGAGGALEYPRLGAVLARELGDGVTNVPRFVAIDSPNGGSGFLGNAYAPLTVGSNTPFAQPLKGEPGLPDDAAFEALDKDNGKTMRKNVTKAFDLADEKAATRDAFGRGRFGTSVLLARRLREAGVPIIEITLGGWDTHGNAAAQTQNVAGQLDAAFAALLTDLHDRKLLDQTLIVWMGEFGRTPRINANGGRDHYPQAFSVVLAGAGIKGGQAIGKTSADGVQIEARPITPPELHATIYQSLGLDPAKKYRVPNVGDVHVLEKGTKAVKESLR